MAGVVLNFEEQLEILRDPLKIKKVICKNGGIYDDCRNWISLASGKITGVIKLKNGACAVLFKAECQSINIVNFDDDNINLQVSNYSIGENYFGALNKENVNKYNDSVIYNNSRIERFTNIRSKFNVENFDLETIREIESFYDSVLKDTEELYGFDRIDIYIDPFETVSRVMLHDDIQRALSAASSPLKELMSLFLR